MIKIRVLISKGARYKTVLVPEGLTPGSRFVIVVDDKPGIGLSPIVKGNPSLISVADAVTLSVSGMGQRCPIPRLSDQQRQQAGDCSGCAIH